MPSTFEILSPDGSPIFLAKLPNEKGNGKTPLHQYVRDEAQLQKFLADHDSPGYAIYHTASILKEGAWRNKDNVRATLFVWGEVDFKDHPDLSREEIVRRLDGIPLRPTFSVFSGHGIHLYWLLKEAEDASPGEGQRRIEEVLRLIANYIGGDPHVAETARLMRLPGSHNSRKPGECLPVTLQDVDLSRRYDLTEIEDFLLEACPIMPPPAAKASEVRGKEFDFSQENDWGPVDVEARLAAMRYMGHGPASIHATQLAVTGSLTRAGKRIEETVARVLARTREVAPANETWNWDKEERDIEDMCKDLVNKAVAAGDDLSHTLPDELFTAWQRIKERGLRPNLSRNLGGLFVRATPNKKSDTAPEPARDSETDEDEVSSNDVPRGNEEPRKYRFKLIPFHEMVAGAGDQDYLVDDLIPSKGIVLLWGPPKCLKSFFMYSAMFHVAKGWEFAGRAVQQGPVIYCAFEGGHGYGKRTDALRARFGVAHDERVPLHVMKCVVIIVHHCGWDESRERGHSSLRGAVDAVLSAKRDDMTVTVTVEHMRDGPEGAQIIADAYKEDVGLDARGRRATSLAVVPRDGEEGAMAAPSVGAPKNDLQGLGDFREALAGAILEHGFDHQIEAGARVKAVDIEKVREEFYRRYVVVSADTATKEAHQDAKRKAFARHFEKAKARHLIGARSNLEGTHQFIWFATALENWGV